MKTAILLGAGSSVPAGFPSTRWLTDLVLSGNGVERHSSGPYQITSGVEAMAGAVRLPNCMVRRLHAEAERYFTAWGDRPANYEDIFYLADQARAEVLGEMENPAIRAFVEELRADLSPLVETLCQNNEDPNGSYEPGIPDSFECLVEETNNYIRDVVWQRLCVEPTNTDHLGPLVAACKSGQLASVSTLCHDTHLEKHLAGQGIPLADGFSDEEEGVRYWNENFSSSAIPFLKLHGSLDWFLLRPRNSPSWYGERVGIPLNGDHNHTKGRDGEFQTALNDRPLLLVGTFNKISEYSQGIFRDLHYQFRRTLRQADQIVVCGYSFGDKGINSEIIEWYYGKLGRRFAIIHPNQQQLVENSRGSIRNKWQEWQQNGSIRVIEKPLEKVEAEEFLRLLHC